MANGIDIEFDPIFGPRATRKFVKDAEKVGKKAGTELSTGVTKKTNLTKAGKKGKKTFKKGFGRIDVAIGASIANAASAAVRQIGAAARQAIDDLRGFSRGISEINSILPANAKLTKEAQAALIGFSNEFGQDARLQAQGFYNIVSAGVKGTAKQLATLEQANKAATAGLVSIDDAAKLLVSSVNAYSNSGLTATEASDALFIAVREGQTTFRELAAFMGNVTGLAGAAGLEFTELTGSIAAFTKAGLATDIAVTGLKQVLVSLAKPSKEAADEAKRLNIEFSTAALRAKGFAGFLKEVQDATKGSEVSLAKLFGNVRALTPVLTTLNGNFAEFKRILDETKNSTGATELALIEIKKSLDFKIQKRITQFKNFFLIIAQGFAEVFLPSLLDSEKKFSDMALGAIKTARTISKVFTPVAEILIMTFRTSFSAFTAFQRLLIAGWSKTISFFVDIAAQQISGLLNVLSVLPGIDKIVDIDALQAKLNTAQKSISGFAQESGEALETNLDSLKSNFTGIFSLEGTETVNLFFDNIEQKVLDLKTAIDEGNPFLSLGEQLKKALKESGVALNETKKKSFDFAAGVGAAFSSTIQSMVNLARGAEGGVKALGKAMLGTIGDLAIQIGTFLVTAGIGKLALEVLPGGAVIAAGAGLIAFGALLKSFSGGEGGLAAGAPATAGGGGVFASQEAGDTSPAASEEIEGPSTAVNLTIQGDVLDSQETGLRITQILNDAFDKQGVVIRNPSFA
jgi:TP901 family phage tail tape measure protein